MFESPTKQITLSTTKLKVTFKEWLTVSERDAIVEIMQRGVQIDPITQQPKFEGEAMMTNAKEARRAEIVAFVTKMEYNGKEVDITEAFDALPEEDAAELEAALKKNSSNDTETSQ